MPSSQSLAVWQQPRPADLCWHRPAEQLSLLQSMPSSQSAPVAQHSPVTPAGHAGAGLYTQRNCTHLAAMPVSAGHSLAALQQLASGLVGLLYLL